MSEHDEQTKQLLGEVLANQQSLHDAIAVLSSRLDSIESTLRTIAEKEEPEVDSWLHADIDPLYKHAEQLVVETGRASTSLLQRVLRVGYARAACLIDLLEANGVIGPSDGAKPRIIMVTQEELDETAEEEDADDASDAETLEDEELYEAAKQAVIEAGKASTSYLQRKLRIGYSRSARLMDMLEENGVIGPVDGLKPRTLI